MRDLWSETAVHVCDVEGCNGVAMFGRYCLNCERQIKALQRIADLADERREIKRLREDGRRTFVGVCRSVGARIWIANLIIVLGAIAYLAFVYGGEFIEWLQLGGWQ